MKWSTRLSPLLFALAAILMGVLGVVAHQGPRGEGTVPVVAQQSQRWEGSINGQIAGISDEGVFSVAFRGESSLIGLFIGGGTHTFSSPLDFEGVSILVSAESDDDKLFIHYQASFDPDVVEPPFPYDGTFTVLGGTGKFRNANGQANLTAELDAEGKFVINYKGKLVLPHAHDKK